jgi:hypothetical protein
MALRVNPSKLHDELTAAGLPVVSVHSTGAVEYSRALSSLEEKKGKSIIEAHNPEPVIKPTDHELILALWAKVMRGDSTLADGLIQQYPDL